MFKALIWMEQKKKKWGQVLNGSLGTFACCSRKEKQGAHRVKFHSLRHRTPQIVSSGSS